MVHTFGKISVIINLNEWFSVIHDFTLLDLEVVRFISSHCVFKSIFLFKTNLSHLIHVYLVYVYMALHGTLTLAL